MQATDIPGFISTPFANAGTKNTIPVASQQGIVPGAASWVDGFPPLTMLPIESGGIAPDGKDFQGVLYAISNMVRWLNIGGPLHFSQGLATQIGGYPKGTLLQHDTVLGAFWLSTADNNSLNPNAGPTSTWTELFIPGFTPVQQGGGIGQLNNKVEIGWSAAGKLKATVDTADLGNFAFENFVYANYPTRGEYVADFRNYLSYGGYQVMKGGLIFQWNRHQLGTGAGDFISFPIAFPNAMLGGLSVDYGSGVNLTGFTPYNAAGFLAYARDANNITQYKPGSLYSYIAWGY